MLDKIQSGDTLEYPVLGGDYPSSLYTCKIVLRGPASYTATAAADGEDYLFTVAKATTATWVAGIYTYIIYVESSTDRFEIERGTVEIIRDYSSTSTYENKTWARRTLEAIEAHLEGRATSAELQYTVAGRTIAKIPLPELLTFRSKLKQEVKNELAAEKANAGLGSGRIIKYRF